LAPSRQFAKASGREVVEAFAVLRALAEFRRLLDDALVGEFLELGLHGVDPVHDAADTP
jgi:hypothetical protein